MSPFRSFPYARSLPRFALVLGSIAAAALLLSAGCGGDEAEKSAAYEMPELSSGGEERLEPPADRAEARAALAAAREAVARQASAVDAASEEVENLRAEIESAESRLQLVRGALDAEQRELTRAEQQMRLFAVPDPVLFRNVQRKLLDAAALREVAIAAEVKQGVVTLRGRVPDERVREVAVQVATGVDGVISVDDLIEVAKAD
jgi:hypothetical protein